MKYYLKNRSNAFLFKKYWPYKYMTQKCIASIILHTVLQFYHYKYCIPLKPCSCYFLDLPEIPPFVFSPFVLSASCPKGRNGSGRRSSLFSPDKTQKRQKRKERETPNPKQQQQRTTKVAECNLQSAKCKVACKVQKASSRPLCTWSY